MWVSPSGSLRHQVVCVQQTIGGLTAFNIVLPVNGKRPVVYSLIDSSLASALCEMQVSTPDGSDWQTVACWFQLLEQSGPSEQAVTPLTIPKFTLPFPVVGYANGAIRLVYFTGSLTVNQVMATAAIGYCDPGDAVDPILIGG